MLSQLTSFRTIASWALFICAAGVIHILTVLWYATTNHNDWLLSAAERPPVNAFRILPPLTPANQPLPFILPEYHYAFCNFDVAERPLRVSAYLPDKGWAVTMHTTDGAGFYFAPGDETAARTITLDLLPPGDALNGLELLASQDDMRIVKVAAPDVTGLIVVRAPALGHAYTAQAIEGLQRSVCRPVGRPTPRNIATN